MPTKSKKLTGKAKTDLTRARRLMISGEEKHFRAGRRLIAQYGKDYPEFGSLGIKDRVKQWIENDKPEVKSRQFMLDIIRDAEGISMLVTDDWYVLAETARAFRYGGMFNVARKRYAKAIRRMGNIGSADTEENKRKSEVLADSAEFWAYLGYIDKAEALLNRIPKKLLKGWLVWVQAFIEHQAAFADTCPFGSSVRPRPVGHIGRYLQSNYSLKVARESGLSSKEVADTFLLEAANWGGIYRRRKDDGADAKELAWLQDTAKNGLKDFRKGAAINASWSWKKEQRGIMFPRWIKGIDAPGPNQEEIGQWRGALINHMRLNLEVAGLEEFIISINPGDQDGETVDDTDEDGGD